jgi:hypothetical protein
MDLARSPELNLFDVILTNQTLVDGNESVTVTI